MSRNRKARGVNLDRNDVWAWFQKFRTRLQELEQLTLFPAKELALLLKLLFFCGLKKKEIPLLRVGDVLLGLTIRERMQPPINNKNPSTLETSEVRTDISKYLEEYQRIRNDDYSSQAPLFPDFAYEKKITRGLHTLGPEYAYNEVHQYALRYFFLVRLEKEGSDRKALAQTAQKFRMSERSVVQSIEDRIQPAGRRKPTVVETLLGLAFRYKRETDWGKKAILQQEFNELSLKAKSPRERKQTELMRRKYEIPTP